MKTPPEARQKICPFKAQFGNRSRDLCFCEGTGCMMWRRGPKPSPEVILHEKHVWEEPPWDREKRRYFPPARPDGIPLYYYFSWNETTGETSWVESDGSLEARWPGYCGLAGKPGE